MIENTKLENRLKTLEGRDDNELIPVKLTVAQVREMLLEGDGETAYNKIYAGIIKSRDELKKSVEEQFKKTEMQKYKDQLKKYVDNICTTIDHLEEYTYYYVDGAIEKQEERMNSVEERIIELVIVKDELEQVKSLNEEINKRYEELDSRHNKVIEEKNTLEEMNKNTESELANKEDELVKKQEELTAVTNKLNDLLLSHKNEVDKLVNDFNEEQRKRVASEQKAYEISLKEESYKTRIDDKDKQLKDYQAQFTEQIKNNQLLMEGLRKEKDAKIEELHSKNNSLSLQVNNLREEKTKLDEVVKTQETRIGELESERNNLEVKNKNLEDIKLKNEGIIKEQENALQTANKKYETDINKVKKDAENEKQQVLEGLIKSHKEEQEELKKQIADLQVDLKVKNEMNGKLEVEAKKVPGLQDKLTTAEGKLNAAIDERDKFEKMYEDLMTKYTELVGLATTKK